MNSSLFSLSLDLFKRHALILAVAIQAAGIFYYAYFLSTYGYLPAPFIYDKNDTFMDLFNTMYWAASQQMYSVWGSVYPPLVFIILRSIKAIFLGGPYFGNAFQLRDAALIIEFFLVGLYLVIPILVFRTVSWKNFSFKEKNLIYWVIILSTPMLFALERGNVIILAPFFLALALSDAPNTRRIALAVLVNLKPYFVLLIFYYVIKRQWRDLWSCTLISGGIFLITGFIIDKSQFLLFFSNLLGFSHNIYSGNIFSAHEIIGMPSSISAFSYLIPDSTVIAQSIELIKWVVLAVTLMTLFYNYQRIRDQHVIAVLVVIISNIGISVGGYSLIFYYALIPVFMNMKYKWIYFSILGLLSFPIDIISIMSQPMGEFYSYLSRSTVQLQWSLGLGSFARPILNFILLIILSYEIAWGTRLAMSRRLSGN